MRYGTVDDVVRRVRQLRSRAERERTGTYYIEGARIVAQAIQAGAEIELGIVAPELLPGSHAHETVAALRSTGVPVLELGAADFENISFKENLQGIGAVLRQQYGILPQQGNYANGRHGWVALDGVGNPGNLGAIMRTCDAVGCSGLLLLGDTTDPYHPTAVRASMGSLFALQIVRTSFADFIRWKNENGHTVVGTTPHATREYRRVTYPRSYILLMGSERTGLSDDQQAACDLLVQIPMTGTSDSLNLGVATSIVLYEIFHRHRRTASRRSRRAVMAAHRHRLLRWNEPH